MAHDSFEEDYELASGNSFRISEAQAAQWHTELVAAEKEIAALRAAAEKARECLESIEGGVIELAPSIKRREALAALEEVLK